MNLDDYKNKLPYPSKADFTTTYYYKGGKLIATIRAGQQSGVIVSDCVREKEFDDDAFKAAAQAYGNESRRLSELFIVDLFHDNGVPDDEFTRALYNVAYQRGHSSGYSEIKSYFEDMCHLQNLAKKVYSK